MFDFEKGKVRFIRGGKYPQSNSVLIDDSIRTIIDPACNEEKLLSIHRGRPIEVVINSHGHEDHDGGLAELVKSTRLKVKAHRVYERLIRKYPAWSPEGHKADFPAKCWHCPMPESFYAKNCLGYHKVLQALEIDPIGDGETVLAPGIRTHHLPGHSPDCVAVLLADEAIIVGDIVLPDITPWPTREEMFDEIADVVEPLDLRVPAGQQILLHLHGDLGRVHVVGIVRVVARMREHEAGLHLAHDVQPFLDLAVEHQV